MKDDAQLASNALPAVFTVYKAGETPRKIHAVDWSAHEAIGWQREPLDLDLEPEAQETLIEEETKEAEAETEPAQATKRKRSPQAS